MAEEIEIKFRIDDPALFRRRLESAAARRSESLLETNWLFDTPDGGLRHHDCGLRVREMRIEDGKTTRTTLTFKGPRVSGELKVREEVETTVHDATAVRLILARLGYRPMVLFEKRRECWQLGACEVTLDELPRLGWWLEIEGPTAEEVGKTRQVLGLGDVSPVAQTYVEMAARHGTPDADGCRHLRFGDPEPAPPAARSRN